MEETDRHLQVPGLAQATPKKHPRDPLHGVTLETIVKAMVSRYGWAELEALIPVRCFLNNPSLKSSLTFLRRTPWARQKLEWWYASGLETEERGPLIAKDP